MMKRKILCVVFAVALLSPAFFFAQETRGFQEEIDRFMTLRMNLAGCASPEIALQEIDSYCAAHFVGETFAAFSAEEKLVFENFQTLERFNYMIQIESQAESAEAMVNAQYDKVTAWMAAHKNEPIGKWLYATAADLLSCHLNFASVGQIMRDGARVRKYYEEALAQDANISYALTNLGQWCYYAPGIAGGSKTTAREFFEKALASARTDTETYFAKIFLSQSLFENKRRNGEGVAMLAEADALQPNGTYISWIRKINSAGFSLLQYYAKRMTPKDIDDALSKR